MSTRQKIGVRPAADPSTESTELRAELVRLGVESGLAVVGVASSEPFDETRRDLVERRRHGLHGGMQFTYRNPARSTDPERILPGARSLLVGAWSYRRSESDCPDAGPGVQTGRVARYARRDHYESLRHGLGVMADRLSELGWRSVVVCDDNGLVDRAAAHRAGIGWFGKNSMLFLDRLGSWYVLGSVVTDALLPATGVADSPHGAGCGTCTRCMQACPTGALTTPGVVDARRCLAWLVQAPGSFPVEFRAALGDRIYGCDACQEVCPINRTAERRRPSPAAEEDSRPGVELLALLASSDEDLLRDHGRWYIAGRDPRYLRRNALVALGNVGSRNDPATVEALRHWSGVEDQMLAEHARWAVERLGCAEPGSRP